MSAPRSTLGALKPHRVVAVLARSGEPALDLSCICQAFATANELMPARCQPYVVELLSAGGGTIEATGGLQLRSKGIGESPIDIDTLVVCANYARSSDQRVIRWVEQTTVGARRICSTFSGIFTLAEGGLLRGRRIATHWTQSIEVQRRYPTTLLIPDAIVVRDGKLWTSSGGFGSIDLALALIRDDCGRNVSREVAMDLVVFSPRSEGQLQFSKLPVISQKGSGRLCSLVHWMSTNLDQALSVEVLAEHMNVSPRHISRLFKEAYGRTPACFAEALRVERAREMLDEGHQKATVAGRCGFTTEQRMYNAFLRQLHVSPSEYQKNHPPEKSSIDAFG